MKVALILAFASFIIVSCQSKVTDSDHRLLKENEQLKKENDSLKSLGSLVDTVKEINSEPALTSKNNRGAGTHPITLQWIGWHKPGEATLTPADGQWYIISGRQQNENREYLNIDGKIKRISEKELEFIGIIETRVEYNNGGEPCTKKGKQVFYASGQRKYFRLQNMENCQGGNLVDYVDIYPGTSGL